MQGPLRLVLKPIQSDTKSMNLRYHGGMLACQVAGPSANFGASSFLSTFSTFKRFSQLPVKGPETLQPAKLQTTASCFQQLKATTAYLMNWSCAVVFLQGTMPKTAFLPCPKYHPDHSCAVSKPPPKEILPRSHQAHRLTFSLAQLILQRLMKQRTTVAKKTLSRSTTVTWLKCGVWVSHAATTWWDYSVTRDTIVGGFQSNGNRCVASWLVCGPPPSPKLFLDSL